MRQLVFEGARSVAWRDVSQPMLQNEGQALVEPVAVSTCDMDALALSGVIRFKAGTPLGHESVARVVQVGSSVRSVAPGDLVIVPWQISCGTCNRCQRGHHTYCTGVPPGSCYGWGPHVDQWGGFFADLVNVPYADHMLLPLPHGMDPAAASGLSDNLVDAWRSVVPPLQETGGGRLLVVGGAMADGGSIGLYAVAFGLDAGADEVVFASQDAGLRTLARSVGAQTVEVAPDYPDLGYFDVTVDTSGTVAGLQHALRSGGPHSICTCTASAVHRGSPPPLPVYEMYMNNVSFRTGWVNTRAIMEPVMERLACNAFDPLSIAQVHNWEEALQAFAEPFTKLVFQR